MKTKPSQKAAPSASDNVRITNLVIGDLLVFFIFAVIGMNSHGESQKVVSSPEAIFVTALPFLAAWFVVSPWLGVYKRGVEVQPKKMAIRTILAWLAAWPVAMILRGIFVDHAIPPWTFWLVAFLANAVLLLLWRVPLAMTGEMRQRKTKREASA